MKSAYRKYVQEYSKTIGEKFGSKVFTFLFSKGRKDKEAGDQFYMVFLSCDRDLDMI